ncbi:MAG: ATP-binding protein [Acutalibacteraceae bacterium]|nr:4Fe-4S binding protein [Clostridiales bacterium]
MKKLLILSGKGGTGKTTVASAFVKFFDNYIFADCDVDAPNLHLVLAKENKPITNDFYGLEKAVIDEDECIGCGECYNKCRFDAIEKMVTSFKVDEFACEGCSVCHLVCPVGAVKMIDDVAGELMLYNKDMIFSTAKLKMGRGNSGKLVTEVKKQLPADTSERIAVIDGSPGIGCPVIASISGVDFVLIVAEPSLSGMSDMERILKTANIFQTKVAVCINKYDTCVEIAQKIEEYCKDNNIAFVGKIPYDKSVSKAINAGKTIADVDCKARDSLMNVFSNTVSLII